MQPLAVSLANYISNMAGRADNPYGAILAGAVRAGGPGGRAVRGLPAALHLRGPRLRGEGIGLGGPAGQPARATPYKTAADDAGPSG